MPLALLGLAWSGPDSACNQIPSAFSRGVTTEQSETLEVLASHCAVTNNRTGAVMEKTIVNWSGIVAAIALCAGAWLLGATIAGTIDRRRGVLGITLAAGVMLIALAAFFV